MHARSPIRGLEIGDAQEIPKVLGFVRYEHFRFYNPNAQGFLFDSLLPNEGIPEFRCILKVAGAIPAMGTQVFFRHTNGSD